VIVPLNGWFGLGGVLQVYAVTVGAGPVTPNAAESADCPAAVCTDTCHHPAASVTFVTVALVELVTVTCDAASSPQPGVAPTEQNHISIPEVNPVPVIVPLNGWLGLGIEVQEYVTTGAELAVATRFHSTARLYASTDPSPVTRSYPTPA
jgi:hypothetical protein